MQSRVVSLIALAVLLTGVVVLGAVTMTSATPAASSCVPGEGYGTQCETLTGHGLTVSGIEARLTADADFFDHPWTFETTIYRCDPRGRTKQECPPTESVRGSIHRPTPNGAPEMCTRVGDQVGGGCTGTLNVALPRTFSDARWVCTEFAVRVNGEWVENGAGLAAGDRACRHVH